ncbi:acyl-CoA carboxylase subunit epsilon [Actinocrinis puniceicyclus]|uniref:Acyl-CoA carboxylase subunit epsilon n=1 Tax=Actinocrinis puniceicyclus TaxID=977794 RepID=A0A8J8BCH4_9ACTN|nr:acyl-CoA carboxylase subunit epsilon [Actinocrinis puniceicyclus]MBS2961779.1 acyl-CoA carboxylase subunit epsilon [Actinocrinis puniceicyclus]
MTATNGTSEADVDDGAATAVTLEIVRGEPTAQEIAALVAVLSVQAAAAGAGPLAPPRRSGWTDYAARIQAPSAPSPGGWRASAFPR